MASHVWRFSEFFALGRGSGNAARMEQHPPGALL
jgi:hypothetical protein